MRPLFHVDLSLVSKKLLSRAAAFGMAAGLRLDWTRAAEKRRLHDDSNRR